MPLDALPLAAPVRAKLKEGWAKLAVAARPPSRRRQAEDPAERAALVALVLDRLACASLHAAAYGTPREVEVPDEATAAIFRAALALTAQRRGTDRLVRVVVRP